MKAGILLVSLISVFPIFASGSSCSGAHLSSAWKQVRESLGFDLKEVVAVGAWPEMIEQLTGLRSSGEHFDRNPATTKKLIEAFRAMKDLNLVFVPGQRSILRDSADQTVPLLDGVISRTEANQAAPPPGVFVHKVELVPFEGFLVPESVVRIFEDLQNPPHRLRYNIGTEMWE